MFVENTATGGMHLDMLEQFLEPQLRQDGILGTVVYQQDGAPPHFALPVREYLNRTFPNRWIGRGSHGLWAARSPDLTPMDFFLWGFARKFVIWQFEVTDKRNMCHNHCGYVTEGIQGYRDPLGIMF